MQAVNVHHFGGRQAAERRGVKIVMRGTPLGNTHVMQAEGDRSNVIELYRKWLWQKICAGDVAVLKALRELKEGDLVGCCCKPRACHADVVIAAARWLAKQDAACAT